MRITSFLLFATVTTGCGSAHDHRKPNPSPAPAASPASENDHGSQSGDAVTPEPGAPEVLRGRWTLAMSSDGAGALALAQTAAQPIAGVVAASVTFTVDNANFATPAALTGVASYGSLDVVALRDNNLRVCGAAGTDRCTKATIRIYTTGTPTKGLWSTVEKLGLPIDTGTAEIGLDAAGAAVVKSVALPTAGVLKLSDLTSAARLAIPVSVDFSNAAVGSYASTLVVEYVLQ